MPNKKCLTVYLPNQFENLQGFSVIWSKCGITQSLYGQVNQSIKCSKAL